jgi:uncharacterized protein involved in type VI secretion and phage assembly
MPSNSSFSGAGENPILQQIPNLWGKYRGTVVDNKDPQHRGRVKVKVPGVILDNDNSWAMPCIPYAGDKVGFFSIPPVDAHVWVEFEGGKLEFPIWSGCWWEEGHVPPETKNGDPMMKVWRTEKATISIDDKDGVVVIELRGKSSTPKITIKDQTITIDNDKKSVIVLKETQKVTINDDGLEVN